MSVILYPIITPFIGYYTLKYAANFVVNVSIDKTKNVLWYIVTYPFIRQTKIECIKCKCEKCKNCEKECQQGYEMKEKID